MTQRELVIVEMLRLRNDIIDAASGGTGAAFSGYSLEYGPDFGVAFRELERLLDVMRGDRPKQRRHLMARYVHACRRPIEVPFSRVKRAGDVRFRYQLPAHTELVNPHQAPSVMESKLARVLVYQWDGWVHDRDAAKGVAWLADQFQGVPALPAAASVAA